MRPSARVTNLTLLALLPVVLLTGAGTALAGEADDRWVVLAHGVAGVGLTLVVVAWKTRVAARGWSRSRTDRWVSALLAVTVTGALVLGLLHATGAVVRLPDPGPLPLPEDRALWWHVAFGLAAVPFAAWHVVARRTWPRGTDLRRRNVLRWSVLAGAAAAAYALLEGAVWATGAPGRQRRFTGSYEVASFAPAAMPRVIWLDDSRPEVDREAWRVTVVTPSGTRDFGVADLRALPSRTWRATLDCTGGWYSTHDWTGVPIATLLSLATGDPAPQPGGAPASVSVTSRTGYWARFEPADAADLLLAWAYDGEDLREGHGGPLRLVAPGSRGPRWVKWVDRVEAGPQPSWWQPPLPLT